VIYKAESWFRDESKFFVQTRRATPQPPYKTAIELFADNPCHTVSFCTIHYGGVNEKMMFRSTSDRAIQGSKFIRECFPDHQVSRADVALDFNEGPDWFNDFSRLLIDMANDAKPKLKLDFRGDWSAGRDGRTLYIGSRKSAVYIRLYEKGIKEIQHGNVTAPRDWVRFEAEIKPEKLDGKLMLSKMTPEQCFGSSRLLVKCSELVFGAKVEPVTVSKVRKMKDHDRSMAHLASQYGQILLDEMDLYDDSEDFCIALQNLIIEQKELRDKKREKLSGRSVDPSLVLNPDG
jgi:hypothetical protein